MLELYTTFFENQKHLDINEIDFEKYIRFCRNLRNLCSSGSCQVQNDVAAHPELIEDCFAISQKLHLNSFTDIHDKAFQISIQFIGNLIVGNKKNKTFIWMKYFDSLRNWTFNKNSTVRNYTYMVIYNLILDIKEVEEHTLKDIHLLEQFVLDAHDGREFASFLVQKLILNNLILYGKLSQTHRIYLIKYIKNTIHENPLRLSSTSVYCFKEITDRYLTKVINGVEISQADAEEIVILLKVLGKITSKSCYLTFLKEDPTFLTAFVDYLCIIHKLGNESVNIFTPNHKLEEMETNELSNQPLGIKTELIRIIANLSYKNKLIQDKVRNMEGIPVILDCCKFDAKNPFIMQWAIFAIGNLCYNNAENKEFIKSMYISTPELHSTKLMEIMMGDEVLQVN